MFAVNLQRAPVSANSSVRNKYFADRSANKKQLVKRNIIYKGICCFTTQCVVVLRAHIHTNNAIVN